MPPPAFRGVQTVAIGSLFSIDREGQALPGGVAALAARQAASLGAIGIAVGRVGMDRFGRELCDRLREAGVDTHAIQTDPDLPTARWTERGTQARLDGYAAFDTLQWDADVEALARSAELIITDACGRRHGQTRSTIDRMLIAAPSAVRVIDLSARPPSDALRLDREHVGQSLELCSVFLVDAVALRSLVPAAATASEGAKRLFDMTRRGTVVLPATPHEPGCIVDGRGVEVLAPLGSAATILRRMRSDTGGGTATTPSAALCAGLAMVTGTALVEVL